MDFFELNKCTRQPRKRAFDFLTIFPLVGPAVGIRLRSEGCNDGDKKPETCGIAYIYVDGMDKSPHGRGHNVVAVDAATGTVLLRSSMISSHSVFKWGFR